MEFDWLLVASIAQIAVLLLIAGLLHHDLSGITEETRQLRETLEQKSKETQAYMVSVRDSIRRIEDRVRTATHLDDLKRRFGGER